MSQEDRIDALALIDRAIDVAKAAAHACQTATARRHFEYALALLNESWIAEGGQRASSAEEVIENVANGLQVLEILRRNSTEQPVEVR